MFRIKPFYLGIFLISLSALSLEISLIRFFSISQWHHFAFMVISIALFGIAASGTFLSIKELRKPLTASAILFAFTTLVAFFILNKITFDPYKAMINYLEVFKLLIYYILLGLPFFFFGIIVAFSFKKYQQRAGKIYFYNLFGSALGSLLALPLISYFNIKSIIIIAIIALFAAFSFSKRKIFVLLAALIVWLFFIPFGINISEYKELNQALNYPNSELLLTKYNSFSRVDIVNSSFTRYAPGLSAQFKGQLPEQLGVLVDGSGMNAITSPKNIEFLNYLPNSLVFSLVQNPKVLVINSGAGLDVLLALKNNATVTALETNPIIIDLLKNNYKDFSGDIYNIASVYAEEGRSFIKKDGKYDVIIVSLAGNVLSSSAGLTSLSENYLLTTEAFHDYYQHLTENGVLIITRWLLYPPRESLKLFSLALEIENAKNRIAMFRSWTTTTLLLSKSQLSTEKLNKIKNFTAKNKFDLIYLPTKFEPNKYAKFPQPYYYNTIKEILIDKEKFYRDYLFDVSPVYDDKPFYFNFFKWKKLPQLYKAIGEKWQPFFDSGFLLFFIFIQALVLALIFILLPLKFFKKTKTKISLAYFFFIGLAYLFIEILFIQKFIMFLGQVIYSSAIVIFSMLLFSSFGSLVSEKLRLKKLKKIIIVLFILIILYNLILPFIITEFMTLNLISKMVVTSLIIAPLAFIMGFPFPLGIRSINKELIPWAFAINGSASVLSTILAVLIALSFGYSFVFLLAAILYFFGFVICFTLKPPQSLEQI